MSLDDVFADRDLRDHLQVPVVLDTDAAERIVRAQEQIAQATRVRDRAAAAEDELLNKPRTVAAEADLEQAQADLEAAEQAATEVLYEFRLTSIGSLAWENLVSLHPPTKKQRSDHGTALDYNPETFPVAAVAACLSHVVYPDGTVHPTGHDVVDDDGQIDQLELEKAVAAVNRTVKSKLKHGHWQQIWSAALRVNVGVSQVPSSLRGSSHPRSSAVGSEPR